MTLVPSLLQAIVRIDGEALVMHVGDKPYVVSPTGQVDLATRGLTLDAVSGIVNQLLPLESQRALDEFDAVQYQMPPLPEFPGEQFTIVAARGGDDLWAEIRRRRVAEDDRVPTEIFGSAAASRVAEEFHEPAAYSAAVPTAPVDSALSLPGAEQLWPGQNATSEEFSDSDALSFDSDQSEAIEISAPVMKPLVAPPPVAPAAPPVVAQPPLARPTPVPPRPVVPPPPAIAPEPQAPAWQPPPAAASRAPSPPPAHPSAPAWQSEPFAPPIAPPPAPAWQQPAAQTWQSPPPAPFAPAPPPPQPAAVLPLMRNPIKPDTPAPLVEEALAGLDRLLRLAAARGASTLYLSSGSRPSVRVDGDIQMLDGAPVLGPNDVESLLLTLMPERNAEALRTGMTSEWIVDLPDVGRVRCMSFRDHRGTGGVFRMSAVRAVTADQLGLSREIQALAIEPEGLILVAGPRSSGKRTLISALVDLINRARRDHVITIESEINVIHDRVGSFISQREVRGTAEEVLAVARAALREDPDVLVVEELRSAHVMNEALDAAASGQLVIGGFPAPNATGAIDRVIDLYPPEYRRQVQLSLAQNLRGVVSQVLLRKTTGGRVAAREVLLNTPAVRSILAEGKTSQLPLAIEGGRAHGMSPLNDALVGFVQNGTVDVREAYRRAADRTGFYALLKRQGLDTAPLERYA